MNGWTMPVQQASFGGVRFDVVSVDDGLERAVVEHAYPFVNGADIEDLGLSPLSVQMQAVFFGEGYYTKFQQFLSAMQKQGAGVLVHPIRGRLPNMLCVSAQFHHEAEFVNYVSVSLTFKEATPAKPIFLFENSLLSKIDALLNDLETLHDDAVALFAQFMQGVSQMLNAKDRLLNCYAGLYACFEQVRSLFDLDKSRFAISPFVSKADFHSQSVQAVRGLFEMVGMGLQAVAKQPSFSQKERFNEVLRCVKQLHLMPVHLVSGKTDAVLSQRLQALAKAHVVDQAQNLTQGAKLSVRKAEMKYVDCAIRLATVGHLTQIGVALLEEEAILPQEVDFVTTKIRTEIQAVLALLQGFVEAESQNLAVNSPSFRSVYTAVATVSERLRDLAHQFTQLALVAINRKPPLLIRVAEFDGNIVQFAHAFYGDIARSDELLRLNPQICYPNFIEKGAVLNSYAK